jgi:hypothetical protein
MLCRVAFSPEVPTVGCVLCASVVKLFPVIFAVPRKITCDVRKGRDASWKPRGTAPAPALSNPQNDSHMRKCGGVRHLLPSLSFVAYFLLCLNNWRNVIKCNHFLAHWPLFTLNKAWRSPLPPAHQHTNVTRKQRENSSSTPQCCQQCANVIRSDVGGCRDTCLKLHGTTPAPAVPETENDSNVGECGAKRLLREAKGL